ncbi:Potassium voltage-gated channel sub A member 2 [Desmophyllum pertusum]|uniref:Potassium voltage-gated channel sub A member 2 n=1 Tax=Desmophyllum pertusum TaxID=174260 RepID=A0A9W9YXV9_9CNID|nr:Potassium voltage-gated channel sub A member 2 [Desmophyllum pertusum]
MNGSLRFSKRAQDCYGHLQSSPQDSPSQLRVSQSPGFIQKRRIRINVRGFQFETFQATLEQFPETMLGCPTRRIEFYDPVRDQYCLDRDPAVFDFILFFYQSNGILACPETISKDAFNEELKFFGITEQDKEDKNSSSTANESLTLSNQKAETLAMEIGRHEDDLNPNCTQRAQTMRAKWWLMMEYPRMSLAGAIWGKSPLQLYFCRCLPFVWRQCRS